MKGRFNFDRYSMSGLEALKAWRTTLRHRLDYIEKEKGCHADIYISALSSFDNWRDDVNNVRLDRKEVKETEGLIERFSDAFLSAQREEALARHALELVEAEIAKRQGA